MAEDPDMVKLSELETRINAAKLAQEPPKEVEHKHHDASLAWRMVVELVVGMAMGVGIGFGLDHLFGTLPIFLMIFALLGFAAGVRTMLRSASEADRKIKDPQGPKE